MSQYKDEKFSYSILLRRIIQYIHCNLEVLPDFLSRTHVKSEALSSVTTSEPKVQGSESGMFHSNRKTKKWLLSSLRLLNSHSNFIFMDKD